MRIAVFHANKQPYAMNERIQLLEATGLVEEVIAGSERQPTRLMPRGIIPYLVDVNSWTVQIVLECLRTRRPWVIDSGDDPATLARNRGSAHWRSTAYGLINRFVVGGAAAVICRGQFHQPILSRFAHGPVHYAPDTVADEILDRDILVGDSQIISTFGSVPMPRTGDRAYGWEVIDVVALYGKGITGVIVANGPGQSALETRAKRLGVASQVHVLGGREMVELIKVLLPTGFVTSIQSNDLAGWVRTTGKLPLSLGLRKYVVASAVGDAVTVLPHEALASIIRPTSGERPSGLQVCSPTR